MDSDYAKKLLEKTREDYNVIFEDFSRTRGQVWEEMKFLEDYVCDNEKVLDLGCGNGRLYEVFREKTIDYYGVDFSEKLIDLARKRYPHFKFHVADALNLPFSADFFDKVFSIAVLHHIPSTELRLKFLKEIKRTLKPEGCVILTVWNFGLLKRLKIILRGIFLKLFRVSKLDLGDTFVPWGKKLKRYIHAFSENEIKRLFIEAGFKPEEIRILKRARSKESNIMIIASKPSL